MTSRPRLLRHVTPGRLLAVAAILVAVFVALWMIPSHKYLYLPDVAHPVAPLVTVAGGHDPTGGGGIYYVDVRIQQASLLEDLFPGLHEGADLVPASNVVPPGVSTSAQHQADLAEMKTSQQLAAAVALRTLGRKVTATATGALVAEIAAGYPASGKLEPTDVIVAVDGKRVRSPADVSRLTRGKPVGSTVKFTVRRGTTEQVIPLATVPSPSEPKRGIVGIILTPSQTIHLPISVAIDAGGVGGPSAGLAFALEVLEKLGRNVDRGHKIAATGEISLDGSVGAIGGIKQKTFGARKAGVDAFLVPVENASEARRYAHGLRIIPVKSFQQALRILATLPLEHSAG